MLEISLDTMAVDAEAPPEEALGNGAPPLIHIQVVGASALPLGDPQNPGRPLRFPSTVVSFPLSRDAALQWADKLKEEAEKLPETPLASSKLAVATSMGEAERMAQVSDKFRKG